MLVFCNDSRQNPDISVGIATGYVFDSKQGKDFSLLHSVHTSAGSTKPHIQCVPGSLSRRVKGVELDADHSLPFIAEVKDDGAVPPLPIRFRGLVSN
jgi:hypothetical protein